MTVKYSPVMRIFSLFPIFLPFLLCFNAALARGSAETITISHPDFTLHCTREDSALLYGPLVSGVLAAEQFFGAPFSRKFDVFVFPDRVALDKQWQQDWGDSTFHSSCWMVASGVGHRLDVLSPRAWKTDACEHKMDDTLALRRLLWHELVHVYHGQHNPVPDFTGLDEMGWWIEGVAVYASGQLDSARLRGLRETFDRKSEPASLQKFWNGKYKYSLSGSMAAWLDKTRGRAVLVRLLACTGTAQVLQLLETDEATLLDAWKKYWLTNL